MSTGCLRRTSVGSLPRLTTPGWCRSSSSGLGTSASCAQAEVAARGRAGRGAMARAGGRAPPRGQCAPLGGEYRPALCLGLWADRWRRQYARGDVIIVRDADDCIVGFAHRDDAERFWRALRARMGQFNLELHPEQTRLIAFGRFAVERRKRRAQGKPETFDFLGFTPIGGKTRNGKFTVRRKTIAPRRRTKWQAVKATLRRRRHWPSPQQGAWLKSGLWGHYRYDAVPRNGSLRRVFRDTIMRYWCQTLRRRSQRHRMTWPRMYALAEPWLPKPHILHPYPVQRLCVTTRGRSLVRSCRTPGSVRGALGNWRPYRDQAFKAKWHRFGIF